MNALSPVSPDVSGPAFEEATAAVNEWRGHLLQLFGHAEWGVSETLVRLAALAEMGTKVPLRRLVGQRFADLSTALDVEGPYPGEGAKAAQALADFRQHEHLRVFLSHGVASVALDRHGRWIVLLRYVAFRGGEVETTTLAYDQREADVVLGAVRKAGRRLDSALRSLRDRLPA